MVLFTRGKFDQKKLRSVEGYQIRTGRTFEPPIRTSESAIKWNSNLTSVTIGG